MKLLLPLLAACLLLHPTHAATGPIAPDAHPKTRLSEAIRNMRLSLDKELVYLARAESDPSSLRSASTARQASVKQDDGFTDTVNTGEDVFKAIRPGTAVRQANQFEDDEVFLNPSPSIGFVTPAPDDSPSAPSVPSVPSFSNGPGESPVLSVTPGPSETDDPPESPSVEPIPSIVPVPPSVSPRPIGPIDPSPSPSELPPFTESPGASVDPTMSPFGGTTAPRETPPSITESPNVDTPDPSPSPSDGDLTPFRPGTITPTPSALPTVTGFPTLTSFATPSPTEDESPTPDFSPSFPSPSMEMSPSVEMTPETPAVMGDTPQPPAPTPTPDDGDGTVCFPADATVEMENGSTKQMAELRLGDRVRVGPNAYSEVFMFTHKLSNVRHSFVRIRTESGHTLSLTKGHYLYVNGAVTAAEVVSLGDSLMLADHTISTVVAVEDVMSRGLYNPQTVHGDIIVDGIRATTYTTAVDVGIAHALLAPLRAVYKGLGWSLSAFDAGADRLANLVPSGSLVL